MSTQNNIDEQIHSLQTEFNRLTRQFWVTKDQIAANRYDLSASKYRQIERDETFFDAPLVTLDRIQKLKDAIGVNVEKVRTLISQSAGN